MKKIKSIAIITAMLLLIMMFPASISATSTDGAIAHWIFQNDATFVGGNVSSDDFTVIDVSGNGNTLKVAKQGDVASDQLKWANQGYNSAKTSLLFDNRLEYADQNASDSFVNIIPVAKWLETVDSAPINNLTFTKGFTIEVIFQVTPEYDAGYNRYSNLIERQGTVRGLYDEGATDPLFALATASTSDDSGLISADNPLGTQLLQMSEDGYEWTNTEGDRILEPGKWYHMAAVNDGMFTTVYINGEEIMSSSATGIATAGFGWDIGVGRKYNDKTDSTLGNDLRGVVRRVFCGQIAEIKISDKALENAQFIEGPANVVAEPKTTVAETTTAEVTVAEEEEETTTTAAETEQQSAENTVANISDTTAATTASSTSTTDDGGNNTIFIIAGIGAGIVVIGIIIFVVAKNKKKK